MIPALAGYWVLSRTYLFHFIVDRHVGYRFIFEMALAGLLMLVIAWSLTHVSGLGEVVWLCSFIQQWGIWAPFDYSGTFAVMAVIALRFRQR